MYKRLTISLVLMGLAAFSIATAVAFFSAQGPKTEVSIQAGTAQLKFEIQEECTGDYVDVTALSVVPANWTPAPGNSEVDCVRITNTGSLPLNLYVHHENVEDGGLAGVIQLAHWASDSSPAGPDNAQNDCGWATAGAPTYTDNRGCPIGSIAANGGERFLRIGIRFPETGFNQNSLQGGTLSFDGYITGYTN